ncbi:Uncharacterised protein [Mycobacteroides abscessus subsp. abscessus]|nr:Uncharacterised protein [Mycobacteroides abscessus subsp. abscessus]
MASTRKYMSGYSGSSTTYAAPDASIFSTSSMMQAIDSVARTYSRGGSTRSAVMSPRNSSVSRSPSSRQSMPSRSARSKSGSSISVTFCT